MLLLDLYKLSYELFGVIELLYQFKCFSENFNRTHIIIFYIHVENLKGFPTIPNLQFLELYLFSYEFPKFATNSGI